jgi:type IV pilus assembly protein PilM
MFKFLALKKETFGLDINDLSLKLVKLKKKRKGFVLMSVAESSIPPGVIIEGVIKDEDALAKTIKSTIKSVKGKKIKTKYAVASLPEEKSFLHIMQMPKMKEKELFLAVPLEAENYIPLPINEVYLDFHVISDERNKSEYIDVLVVAMPKKIVNSYVSCFKKAGIVPVIFETESEAIARSVVRREKNPSSLVLIDIGQDVTNFIIHTANFNRFTSSVTFSSQQMTAAVSESMGISLKEAEKLKIEHGLISKKSQKSQQVANVLIPLVKELAQQISKYISFYCNHSSYEYFLPTGKINKILICGGGSKLNGLTDFISKELNIPTEIADPLTNLLHKRKRIMKDRNIPSFATAIGLAMREEDIGKNLF